MKRREDVLLRARAFDRRDDEPPEEATLDGVLELSGEMGLLLDKLPEAQVRDLFRYLQSSRPPAK